MPKLVVTIACYKQDLENKTLRLLRDAQGSLLDDEALLTTLNTSQVGHKSNVALQLLPCPPNCNAVATLSLDDAYLQCNFACAAAGR